MTCGIRYLQSVSILEAVSNEFPFGEVEQPVEAPPTVSVAVELSKSLVALLKLCRQGEGQRLLERP